MKRSATLGLCVVLWGCSDPTPFNTTDASALDASALDSSALDAARKVDAEVAPLDAPRSPFTVAPLRGREPPAWRISRVWTVSAPLGFRADNTPLFGAFHDVFAAPNHAFSALADSAAHLVPHDGPYDAEVDRALARAHITPRELFSAREFSAPQAVYFIALVEASESSPRGRTPDGEDRPMIPNGLLPLTFDGTILRNGGLYDPDNLGRLIAPAVAFAGTWEGYTHAYFILAEDSEYAPPTVPIEGRYQWLSLVSDASGQGYSLTVPFEVRCSEPDRDLRACATLPDAGSGDVTDAGSPDSSDASDGPSSDGSGSLEPGSPCAADADCGAGGFCIDHLGTLVFPGGYCTYACDAPPFGPMPMPVACRGVGVCIPIGVGLPWVNTCLRDCASGCRSDYQCTSFFTSNACMPRTP